MNVSSHSGLASVGLSPPGSSPAASYWLNDGADNRDFHTNYYLQVGVIRTSKQYDLRTNIPYPGRLQRQIIPSWHSGV